KRGVRYVMSTRFHRRSERSPDQVGIARMRVPKHPESSLRDAGAKQAVDEHRVGGKPTATERYANGDAARPASNGAGDGGPNESRGTSANHLECRLGEVMRASSAHPTELEGIGRNPP